MIQYRENIERIFKKTLKKNTYHCVSTDVSVHLMIKVLKIVMVSLGSISEFAKELRWIIILAWEQIINYYIIIIFVWQHILNYFLYYFF